VRSGYRTEVGQLVDLTKETSPAEKRKRARKPYQ